MNSLLLGTGWNRKQRGVPTLPLWSLLSQAAADVANLAPRECPKYWPREKEDRSLASAILISRSAGLSRGYASQCKADLQKPERKVCQREGLRHRAGTGSRLHAQESR